MELRTTEQEVNEMLVIYESLHRHNPTHFISLDDNPGQAEQDSLITFITAEAVLKALESLQTQCMNLEPRIQKFRLRLAEKDPISDAPRYGAKTAVRVHNLLIVYGAVRKAIFRAFGMPDDAADTAAAADPSSVVSSLRQAVEVQQTEERLAKMRAQQLAQAQQAHQLAQEEQARQEEERQRLQAQESRRQEEEEIARQAEESRQRRARAAQAERDWVDSIPKGPQGVRQQIQRLKDDTQDDPVARKTALSALLTMFTQIAQHPEEINFRRIRRDHPKFQQDIGRHQGGKEILIAAGFQLVTLDEIPCFFSKEPDLETNMDEWSLWFDNLKANLEVVKDMQK
jgi:PUB domain